MASDGPDGCTSVEEWLAQGGQVTTERPTDADPIVREVDGETYEFVRDDSSTAPFRCQITDVYGYKPPAIGTAGIRPHRCRWQGCEGPATNHRGGRFWCDEHKEAGRG